jgi:flagellar biosynthesis protein FlhF
MNIKRFIAGNAQEAMRLVKKEMGAEAVILRTRTLPASEAPYGGSGSRVEVMAAMDYDAPVVHAGNAAPPQTHHAGGSRWEQIEKELRELKEAVLTSDAGARLIPGIPFHRELRALYAHFKTFGIDPLTIQELMGDFHSDCRDRKGLTDADLLQESLTRVLARITLEEQQTGNRPKRVQAFVGPTGVGKTTTLAKLAALTAVKQGKKTALITLDTFRIAAVSQLQTYARIMNIPLEVAASREDLRSAIRKHRECDRIFVDTAGRSPNNLDELKEQARLLDVSEKIHTYLVLSATTQQGNLFHAADGFGGSAYQSYIFTKLDEVTDISSMLNFLISAEKPVSYFTTGQQVPEDIEAASKKKLALHLLEMIRKKENDPLQEVKNHGSGNGPQVLSRGEHVG